MATQAKDGQKGRIYRFTRGGGNTYLTLYGPGREKLLRRWRRKGPKLSGREHGLLGQMERDPSLIPYRWHLRGTDPMTGDRFEVKKIMVLPPDHRLREVKNKPGYK